MIFSGEPVVSILLAPAVTPWETTLPGVIGGAANNPSIRLVEYDRTTGEVLDIHQYYLNLTDANLQEQNGRPAEWIIAYKGTEYFDIPNMGTASLNELAQSMINADALFQKYYAINGVLYDPNETCTEECKYIHYCAITEVEYPDYEACVNRLNSSSARILIPNIYLVLQLAIISLLIQLPTSNFLK